jgi:hypothetical protein
MTLIALHRILYFILYFSTASTVYRLPPTTYHTLRGSFCSVGVSKTLMGQRGLYSLGVLERTWLALPQVLSSSKSASDSSMVWKLV